MTKKRFQVALSFPGEQRSYVLEVAQLLTNRLGEHAVFYDDWYKHELARPNLDTYLQRIYHQETQLLVPFLCADYEKKEWCGLEWRAIRDLIKQNYRQDEDIMPLRFDDTQIDGYIDLRMHTPEQISELIIKRLKSNYANKHSKSVSSSDVNAIKIQTDINSDELIFNCEEDINETASKQSKPIDRLKTYLHDIDGWKTIESGCVSTFHYEQFPEFTIVENDDFDEQYNKPWVSQFPDPRYSSQHEYLAKYQGTTIAKIYIVCCDGGRFLTAKPREWLKDSPQAWSYTYYFIEDSIEYLAGQMIQELGGSRLRNSDFRDELKLFKSDADAKESINADFASDIKKYVYYCFDKETEQYSRIVNGVSNPINCIL